MARVISLCSSKGGVGKSSCTVELANAIRNLSKKRVLVIDLDENCSLAKNVGADIASENTIYEVMTAKCDIEDAVQHNDLFDIVVGSKSLSMATKEFTERDDVYILSDIVDMIKDDYDYIFFDNAPSRSVLLTMTYIATDYVIIPTVADESSVDLVFEAEEDIRKLVENRNHDSHAKVIGYILNNYKRSTMYDIAMESLEDNAEGKDPLPFIVQVPETIKVTEVKTLHTAMCQDYKSSPVARAFYNIAEKVLEFEEGDK